MADEAWAAGDPWLYGVWSLIRVGAGIAYVMKGDLDANPSRARLMWFMLVGDNPEVAELARIGQERLAGLTGLDPVPQQWLHMTTLIAGFADEITPDQVDAMACQARRLLARTPPVRITLERVLYHPRAIMLDARPYEALEPVLRASQSATWHLVTEVAFGTELPVGDNAGVPPGGGG